MATVRKVRGHYVADYYDQHKRRHMERPRGFFENKAQERKATQELLAKRLAEVSAGTFTPHRARFTFAQVAERYLASKVNLRGSTAASYRSLAELYLVPYFGDRKMYELRAADIEAFRDDLMKGYPAPVAAAFAARGARKRAKPGVHTINKAITLLRMIYNYAERHEWVDRNAAKHVEKVRSPVRTDETVIDTNVLTTEEVKSLIEAADVPRRGRDGQLVTLNYRLLIKVAVFTGMRQGEILGLQWGDVDWHARSIFVRRAWKEGAFVEPKTAASVRRIELPAFLVSELREWRLACPKGDRDLVFPNRYGNPMEPQNLVKRGFYPALRRAGLRRIRFHDLRHTFASLLLANGEPVTRVSRLLGHASINVTLRVYAHAIPDARHGSTDRLAEAVFGNDLETSPDSGPPSRAGIGVSY